MMIDELLAEIDQLKEADRIVKVVLRLLGDAFDGPLKGLILLGDSLTRNGIPAMVREIVRLRGEVVELNELLVSRSELAATTIAGLEREVASLQISLKVHVDGECRLRAEVFRLRAERESNERRY
jgi:hypothetical protein